MVICLERCADLHMAQLMPLPLTVSCFSKIQIGFVFLVPAHLASPRQRAIKRVCVYEGYIASMLIQAITRVYLQELMVAQCSKEDAVLCPVVAHSSQKTLDSCFVAQNSR